MSTPEENWDEPATDPEPAHEPAPITRPVRRAPERKSPHTSEAQDHVLSCCFLDEGITLTRAIEEGIGSDHFTDPALRKVWTTLTHLHSQKAPLTLEAVASAMGTDANWPLLLQLTDASRIPTTAHYAHYAGQLREQALRRTLSDVTSLIADRGSDDPATVSRDILARLKLATATRGDDRTALAQRLDRARVRFAVPPPEPTTRLFLAGKPIATPGNLVTLIAKSKTGKTAATGAAVAAIIGAHYDRSDLDTFKFTAPHTSEAVILIDTEQSPYDAWTCHSRTMARSGGGAEPEWLHHYALVGDSAAELRKALPVALDRGRSAHGGVFCLILDGVADFVASVNDEAECNDFVAHLRALAVQFDCPIICVIHSNEGLKTGDDGRGHLGKQLTRKAESNLLLKKVGDITTITSEKQRKAPITESDGVAFQWSDEHGRHVSCVPSAEKEGKRGRAYTYNFEDFTAIFPKNDARPISRNALFRYAADMSPIKETAFRDLLNRAVQDGQLERLPDGQGFSYRLPKV